MTWTWTELKNILGILRAEHQEQMIRRQLVGRLIYCHCASLMLSSLLFSFSFVMGDSSREDAAIFIPFRVLTFLAMAQSLMLLLLRPMLKVHRLFLHRPTQYHILGELRTLRSYAFIWIISECLITLPLIVYTVMISVRSSSGGEQDTELGYSALFWQGLRLLLHAYAVMQVQHLDMFDNLHPQRLPIVIPQDSSRLLLTAEDQALLKAESELDATRISPSMRARTLSPHRLSPTRRIETHL